jgi:hypothetical protein
MDVVSMGAAPESAGASGTDRATERQLLRLNPVVELTLLDREAIGRGVPLQFGPNFGRYAELHRDLGFEATVAISDVRRLIAQLQRPNVSTSS